MPLGWLEVEAPEDTALYNGVQENHIQRSAKVARCTGRRSNGINKLDIRSIYENKKYETGAIWGIAAGGLRQRGLRPFERDVSDLVEILRHSAVDEWDQLIADYRPRYGDQSYFVERSERLSDVSTALSLVAFVVSMTAGIFSAIGYATLPSAVDVLDWVVRSSPLLVTPMGVIGALLLFACRGYLPKLYGTLEIIVGIATVNASSASLSLESIPSVLPFMAGVYVVIRGLDNFAKALNQGSPVGSLFSICFNNPSRMARTADKS